MTKFGGDDKNVSSKTLDHVNNGKSGNNPEAVV